MLTTLPDLQGSGLVFVCSVSTGGDCAVLAWDVPDPLCMHSELGCVQGTCPRACTQQPCLGSLPGYKRGACSHPFVNVLVGNKWVSPSFGTKIVQSL